MERKHKRLTPEKRSEIYLLHAEGKPPTKISQILEVHKSTISRELERNKDPHSGVYFPDKAEILAQQRRNRPGSKIERSKALQTIIVDHIAMGWSPEVIAGRLETEEIEHTISHESIYKWIYGEGHDAERAQLESLWGASIVTPEFKELEKEREQRRYKRQEDGIKILANEGALLKGLSIVKARDILWAFMGRDMYRLFVVEQGWTSEEYERWFAQLLIKTLLREE